MPTIRDVLRNTIETVAGCVPPSPHGSCREFRHAAHTTDPKALESVKAATRLFLLAPTGERTLGGWSGQEAEPYTVTQTLDLTVLYRQGPDAAALVATVAEDVDALGWSLAVVDGYDPDNTGLVLRSTGDYQLTLGDSPTDVAELTLPISVTYVPTMGG